MYNTNIRNIFHIFGKSGILIKDYYEKENSDAADDIHPGVYGRTESIHRQLER